VSAPDDDKAPFVPRVALDGTTGSAARWWNQSLAESGWISRRRAITLQLVGGGVAIGTLALAAAWSASSDDDVEGSMDALELQRRTSWNVGDLDRRLELVYSRTTDADDSTSWDQEMRAGHLAAAFAPGEERLQPYYAPTLFQASDGSPDLRQRLYPILRPSMSEFYDRGRALADAFDAADNPHDTALVIDLHGPESIAVAAALADQFAPVFTFDNWPHPRGVVPSHETLAAALYYLPLFQRAAKRRPTPAPPAFVLDADRLSPYRDAVEHFDNRYTVSLPSGQRLQSLGVSRLLYVRGGDAAPEEDDLNADFAWLDGNGIPVRLVSLGDFQPAAGPPDAGAPASGRGSGHVHYSYGGGGSSSHVFFWHQYGWYKPAAPRGYHAPVAAPAPSRAASYRPVTRPTMFSTRMVGGIAGIGKTKPTGFGRISIRTARGTGAISVGRGRSGSFGRGSSSYFG
jgi:hypothetical protein